MFTRNLFNLTPWPYRTLLDELSRMRDVVTGPATAGVFPLINVTQDKDNFYVRAELPGISADELDITATGNTLAIAGERKIPSAENGAKYHRREREAGKFSRMFNLPKPVDADKIEANFGNGILTLVLPKSEALKAKKITVK